jgi:hypothetical protein
MCHPELELHQLDVQLAERLLVLLSRQVPPEGASAAAMPGVGLGSGAAVPREAGVVLLFLRAFMIDRSPSTLCC